MGDNSMSAWIGQEVCACSAEPRIVPAGGWTAMRRYLGLGSDQLRLGSRRLRGQGRPGRVAPGPQGGDGLGELAEGLIGQVDWCIHIAVTWEPRG